MANFDNEYSSNAKGNTGVALGSVGTGLGVLQLLRDGGLGNIFGGGNKNNDLTAALLGAIAAGHCNNHSKCSDDEYVTRYEAKKDAKIAEQGSEISLLKSEQNTEVKIADVYERLERQIRENKDAQTAINTQQAVYNGTNNATISCLKGQVDQLYSLTQLSIPNTAVCPGWGNVCVDVTPCPSKKG